MHLRILSLLVFISSLKGPADAVTCYSCQGRPTKEKGGTCRATTAADTDTATCTGQCQTKIEDKTTLGMGIWYKRACVDTCTADSGSKGSTTYRIECCTTNLCNGPGPTTTTTTTTTTPTTTTTTPATTPTTTPTTTTPATTTTTTPTAAPTAETTTENIPTTTTTTTTTTTPAGTAGATATPLTTTTPPTTITTTTPPTTATTTTPPTTTTTTTLPTTTTTTTPPTTTATTTPPTTPTPTATTTTSASADRCYECATFFLADVCEDETIITDPQAEKVVCDPLTTGTCAKVRMSVGFSWLEYGWIHSRGCSTNCSGVDETIKHSAITDIHCCAGDLCNKVITNIPTRVVLLAAVSAILLDYFI